MGAVAILCRKVTTASLQSEEDKEDRLIRISYTSTMCGNVAAAGEALEHVVRHSVQRNAQRGLSGLLCYDAQMRHVWQALEGDPETVHKLWGKISKDTRHVVNEDMVRIEEVSDRKYQLGWGMRYEQFNGQLDKDIRVENKRVVSAYNVADDSQVAGRKFIQLTYKSFLKADGGVEKRTMEGIIAQAVVKNAKADITGFLLYNEQTRTIYQVLEGPPESVNALFEVIKRDPRHAVCESSVRRRATSQRTSPVGPWSPWRPSERWVCLHFPSPLWDDSV